MKFPVEEKKVIDLLRSILRINTENPPGNESPVAHLLGDYLKPLGFEIQYFEPEPNRTSLLGVLRGEGGGRSLLMNGHIDIGPIGEGWTMDPLGGEIKDGKIYGRGTGDMKSGIAAMVCAAEAVLKSKVKRRGDLYLALVADESSGGHIGAGYMIKHADITADMGIVGEPTGGHIGVAHQGVVWVRINIQGKSGQAARPWSGTNAILYASKIIVALDRELPLTLNSKKHRYLDSPTQSIGIINGGIKTNVIPEYCTIFLDRRTLPGENTGDVLDEIKSICDKAVAGSDVKVNVDYDMVVEASEISADAEVVKECRIALKSVINIEPGIVGSEGYGFADAHWFTNNLGIPTAVFGPWYLHLDKQSVSDTPDEHNYVKDIILGTEVYANLITNVIR